MPMHIFSIDDDDDELPWTSIFYLASDQWSNTFWASSGLCAGLSLAPPSIQSCPACQHTNIDSIAVSVFVVILVEFDKY